MKTFVNPETGLTFIRLSDGTSLSFYNIQHATMYVICHSQHPIDLSSLREYYTYCHAVTNHLRSFGRNND